MIFSHLCSTGFGLPYSIVTLNEYQFQIYSMVGCPTLCLVWGQACWRVLLCFCSSFSSQHSLHASATERKGLCPRACSSLLSKPLCVLLGARLVIGGAVVVLSLLGSFSLRQHLSRELLDLGVSHSQCPLSSLHGYQPLL